MATIEKPDPIPFMCGVCWEEIALGKDGHNCDVQKAEKVAELHTRYQQHQQQGNT